MFRAKDQLSELTTRCVSIFNVPPMNILTDENVKRSLEFSFSSRRVLFFHESERGGVGITKPSSFRDDARCHLSISNFHSRWIPTLKS